MRKLFILSILVSLHFLAISQNKKIINDYQELVSSLVSIKSEAEQYAIEVKATWPADSFMVDCKIKYANLKASVDAIIASFQSIIKKPSLISTTVQKKIDDDLAIIKTKAEAFKFSYVKGATARTGGTGFSNVINPILLLQSGLNLYVQIKGLTTGVRNAKAKEFKETCAMRPWIELQ